MARNGTFDTKRVEARRLYDQGLSCRAIARQLKCSPSTVSRWAEAEGLKFDRAKTAEAVAAHTIDLAASRTLLAQKMIGAAHVLLDSVGKPYTVFNFGGKDNTYAEHSFDTPPVEVQRNIMTTAGIAFDKATRIVEKDNGGLESTVGVLDALAGNLTAAAAMLRAEGETAEPDAAT